MSARNKCWCGVENPYFAAFEHGCGGTGVLNCYCGGDLCVCHWHGETQCPGCEECEENDSEPQPDDYDPEEDHPQSEWKQEVANDDEMLRRVDP